MPNRRSTNADARIAIRVAPDVKAQSQQIYEQLGLDLSAAINVFLKKSIRMGGFPFSVTLDVPNEETVKAIVETENGVNTSVYSDANDLWSELNV